jgi:hypothetical protein
LAAVRTTGIGLVVTYVMGLAALVASNAYWAYLVVPLLVAQALFGAAIGGRKLHRPLPAWRFAFAICVWCALAALVVMSVMLSVGSAVNANGDSEILFAFGGLLAFVAAIGLGVWQTWQRARYVVLWRLAGSAIAAGLAVGLLAVLLFYTVDFKGELPGLAALLGAVAGFTSAGWGFGLVAAALALWPAYLRALRQDHYCDNCEYDLTGTLAAGRIICPECGSLVRRRG